jgi:uncharacterized protein (TIGR03437 family)
MSTKISLALILASVAAAQNYPYFIDTVAGSYPLGNGGPATSALLEYPRGLAVDGGGNMYIGDNGNLLVRKVAAGSGVITSLPGGVNVSSWDVQVDAAGNVYFSDALYRVFRLTPAGGLTVIAGSAQGFAGDGASATQAQLRWPYGLAVDSAGNVYIADSGNQRIRRITKDGIIRTIAGTGSSAYNGDNMPATSANLNGPRGIAVDAAGNLYIADYGNRRIRKVAADGTIGTLAGTGAAGTSGDGGPATSATLQSPIGLALDAAGNVYFSDSGRVRKIATNGTIQTVAGTGIVGFSGDGGPATSARIDPYNLAVDAAGNLYLVDYSNSRVRMVTPDGRIRTVAGASHLSGDGGPATGAVMHTPYDVAFDRLGNMYVADTSNHVVRKVDAAGKIGTYAGTGDNSSTVDSGIATQVNLNAPRGLATDVAGNLYIADYGNCRVRRVGADGNITTVAGTGSCLDSGDGGPATAARLSPWAVAVDAAGNLYISDATHARVRKVAPDGTIGTVAGTGTAGSGNDGIPATESALNSPYGLAVDKKGNLLIVDSGNHRVRMVDAAGVIRAVAGNGDATLYLNDGKPASTVPLYSPYGIAADGQGNLYITQATWGYVRKVDTAGIIHTIAGFLNNGFAGDGGPASNSAVNLPRGLAVDAAGDVFFADSSNHRVRRLMVNSPVRLEAAAGNLQAAPVGMTLPKTLDAKVMGRAAAGVPGVKVAFAVTSGTATLYPNWTYTDARGLAALTVVLGNTPGIVTVTATASGLPPAVFNVGAMDPNAVVPGGPNIAPGGIAGAGPKEVSANGIVSIYGDGFAPAGTERVVTAADMVNGRLPTKLGGICVQVGTAWAPILAVYPKQLNIQIPYSPLSMDTPVQVVKNCGDAGEVGGNMQSVMVRYATPEFFYFAYNASGKNPIAAADAVSGALIGPLRPAKPGDVLTLYGTGFGATSPPTNAGEIPTKIARTVLPPKVTVGGVVLASSDVLYAGVALFSAGLYQVNIRIPASVPDGDQPVTLQLGQYVSPAGGFITVQR